MLGIDVKRCLCIHAVSQLVDITLQSLLYQRQIIPEPVATLAKNDSHAADQFKAIYEKVTRIIQETFRTPNTGRIAEFVILIGGTPYSPKEIYRIPVPICRNLGHRQNDGEEEEMENGGQRRQQQMREENEAKEPAGGGGNGCCGPACEELSAKEKRLVFSAVALSKTAVGHFENCPMPGKTDKVFMFIRAKGQLNTWTEGLLEDESFELPDDKVQQRRKIRQLRVEVHSACCANGRPRGGRGGKRAMNNQNGGQKNPPPEAMVNGNRRLDENVVAQNGDGDGDDEEGKDGDDSSELEEEEEEEEGDENALISIWYRIAPFFATLH